MLVREWATEPNIFFIHPSSGTYKSCATKYLGRYKNYNKNVKGRKKSVIYTILGYGCSIESEGLKGTLFFNFFN